MNDGGVITYDLFPDGNGWMVFNVRTHEPAYVNGIRQTQLPRDDADDLIDLLTLMEAMTPGSSLAWAAGRREPPPPVGTDGGSSAPA